MVKTNQLGKFGHILCILGAFWAINGHSRGSTSHHLSDLIFKFLESVDLEGWGQLDSKFKNINDHGGRLDIRVEEVERRCYTGWVCGRAHNDDIVEGIILHNITDSVVMTEQTQAVQ